MIKNVELSYYNFEKKNQKKSKEKERGQKIKQTMTRNKKSMPLLPFYQYQQKPSKENYLKVPSFKEANRLSCKSKSKEQVKKVSASNSIETPKNLSRTKSKSNLVSVGENVSKQPTISLVDKSSKSNRSEQVGLQKTQSSRNVCQRPPLEEKKDFQVREVRRESMKKH